jgi:hypothetical protein
VVAASNVPTSASQGSLRLQVDAEGQPPTSPPSSVPPTPSVDQPYGQSVLQYLHTGDFASRSASNASSVSFQSRASDRRSRITSSREALDASIGQSAELPRSPHHQFGRGPDPSRSGGRLSRSPSPIPRSSPTQQTRDLDNVQTGVPTHGHGDAEISHTLGSPSPADPPSSSSNTQEPQSTTFIRGKKQKTTSVALGIQGPSSESLPAIGLQQVTEEPVAIGSPTHSSINSSMEYIETTSQRVIMASSLSLPELILPEHRLLQQIISEEVTRYTRNITMQVDALSYVSSLYIF